MKRKPFVFQIVGYSNTGKTTLITKLIPLFEQQGIRVGVIKHDGAHDVELDQPGKDTYRYREAGASLVAIQSRRQTAVIVAEAVPLERLVEQLADAGAELVLVEGFKAAGYEKLVMVRDEEDVELVEQLSNVVAVASWEASFGKSDVSVYSVDDVEGIFRVVMGQYSV